MKSNYQTIWLVLRGKNIQASKRQSAIVLTIAVAKLSANMARVFQLQALKRLYTAE